MLESAVKLKALMTTSGGGNRGSLIHFTDDTIMQFTRFIKGELVQSAPAEQVTEASLGEAKADVLESDPEARPGEQNGE